jgi:hypothetical protein
MIFSLYDREEHAVMVKTCWARQYFVLAFLGMTWLDHPQSTAAWKLVNILCIILCIPALNIPKNRCTGSNFWRSSAPQTWTTATELNRCRFWVEKTLRQAWEGALYQNYARQGDTDASYWGRTRRMHCSRVQNLWTCREVTGLLSVVQGPKNQAKAPLRVYRLA